MKNRTLVARIKVLKEVVMQHCFRCGSERSVSCGDFIKKGEKIFSHRKCLKCGKCFLDRGFYGKEKKSI